MLCGIAVLDYFGYIVGLSIVSIAERWTRYRNLGTRYSKIKPENSLLRMGGKNHTSWPPEYVENGYADLRRLSGRSFCYIWQLGAAAYEFTTARELRKTINENGSSQAGDYFIEGYGDIHAITQKITKTRPEERMKDESLKASLNKQMRARNYE
ncbi:hypothetical protein EG328_006106 [Venturia inaequalis]|uniref:Uncharacterized protein n=1 Tax=Venturia inaequalis TaxID=5025 RepID=A0A8H3YUV2_VENIN|nr:hypothetical protein EG328_006106 [Venturia inaequalis]